MNIPVSLAQAKWDWNGRKGTIETFLPTRNGHEDLYINAVVNGTKWAVWQNDKLVAMGDDDNAQWQAERVICSGVTVNDRLAVEEYTARSKNPFDFPGSSGMIK